MSVLSRANIGFISVNFQIEMSGNQAGDVKPIWLRAQLGENTYGCACNQVDVKKA